jgi:SSU ribosomal protein S10P
MGGHNGSDQTQQSAHPLRAFDHRILDQSVQKIVNTARDTGARISGPVLLPTEKNIFCVNRGTTIDKESMEHLRCAHISAS